MSDDGAAARDLAQAQEALGSAIDEQTRLLDDLLVERAAGDAARWQNAVLLEESLALQEREQVLVAELAAERATSEQLRHQADSMRSQIDALGLQALELQRLQNTKLLRWAARPRRVYARVARHR